MTRLPNVGSDSGQWGTLLNEFLTQEHNADGSLKSAIQGGTVEKAANKGALGGYAPLDTNIKVPPANLPTASGGTPFVVQKNDVDQTPRGKLDFVGEGVQLTDDLAGDRTRIHVQSEFLDVTDPRVGLVPNLTTDQGTLMQAGINLIAASARGGTLFFPAGEYRNNSVELTLPADKAVTLRGAGGFGDGASPTLLRCLTDQGSGKYAIIADGTTNRHTIEKLTLLGPRNPQPFNDVHAFPAAMIGIKSTGHLRVVDSNILGFWAGISLLNPRVEIVGTYMMGNGHAIFYRAGSNGGDLLLDRVALDAQAISGICIDPAATAKNITMLQCHMGQASAYCFFRPGTPGTPSTNPLMLQHLVVIQCSYESPSNGVLYDQPGDGIIDDLTFIGNPEANIMGAVNYPTIPREAGWKCAEITNFYSYGLIPLNTPNFPAFKAKTIENVGLYDPVGFFDDASNDVYTAKKFAIVPGGRGMSGVQVGPKGADSLRGGAFVASGTISKWDLVQMDAERTVKVHTGLATDKIVGVALHSCTSGQVCHTWTSGRFSAGVVKIASGRTVSQDKVIKADPNNPGYVMQASSVADPNIVGIAMWSSTGGDSIDVKLRIS
jgi:hypothetical protein